MADKIAHRPNILSGGSNIPVTFKDMGDGTYAEVVSFDADGITIGEVNQGDAGADPWLVVEAGSKLGTGGTGTAAAIAAPIGGSLACQSVLLTNTHATLTLKFGNVTAQPMVLN